MEINTLWKKVPSVLCRSSWVSRILRKNAGRSLNTYNCDKIVIKSPSTFMWDEQSMLFIGL